MAIDAIERKDFVVLRRRLHDFIYNKQRSIDELIYAWDFFREHMVVTDCIIKQRFLLQSKANEKSNPRHKKAGQS